MKKIIPFCLFALLFFLAGFSPVFSQSVIFSSGFEAWTGSTPDGWMGAKTNIPATNVLPYTTSVHTGATAVQLINTGATHNRFTTQPLALDSGTTYTINFWVRGQGNIRTGLFDNRPTGSGYATYNPYIQVNSTSWSAQSQSILCAKTTTIAEFILSVQSTVATNDNLQIDDVVITEPGAPVPTVLITSPANNSMVYATSVQVNFNVTNFVVGNPGTGIDGHIHYYLDGGPAVMYFTTNPITFTSLAPGAHQVILQLVDNSHNPLAPNRADTVNFTIDLNPPNLKTIYDIQFTQDPSGNSPLMDSLVSVYGTVTAVHAAGYFIQDAPGPWNGVYVYDNVNHPAIGDSVVLSGTVTEYYNLTEIKLVTSFSILANNMGLPAPSVVSCAQINAEEYESVLVKASHVTCTNTNSGFGMWRIQDALGDTAKVHNLFYTYSPQLNAVYDITGPVYYSFNEFRIEPRNASDVLVITGIGDTDAASRLGIYPNPVVNEMIISGLDRIDQLQVSSVSGQRVLQLTVTGQATVKLDLSALMPGTYFLSAQGSNGTTTLPFIKQ